MSQKSELRKRFSVLRDSMLPEERAASDEKIRAYAVTLCKEYESVLVYRSFRSEVDTSGIIDDLLSAGKIVYLPRMSDDVMLAVPYGECHKGAYGIDEPDGEPYLGDIDVALVPLLAVDCRGHRIGYGKGCYDRFLTGRKIFKIGLLYSVQMSDEDIETDCSDVALDGVISEKGIFVYGEG